VVAKLEYMNPGGSIKDRMVRHMLQRMPQGTERVVEGSSGNTGAALAMASAVLGLDCEVTIPDTTSTEKVKRIEAYGARVHRCATSAPAEDYASAAKRIAQEQEAHFLDQYCSRLNSEAHYTDTGPELWQQLAGEIDVFVCGIGSGGTISGIGRYLKERDPHIKVIGVEPLHSAYRKQVTDRPANGNFQTVIEGLGKSRPSVSLIRPWSMTWFRCRTSKRCSGLSAWHRKRASWPAAPALAWRPVSRNCCRIILSSGLPPCSPTRACSTCRSTSSQATARVPAQW
jgi:cystathionine beta-synthase